MWNDGIEYEGVLWVDNLGGLVAPTIQPQIKSKWYILKKKALLNLSLSILFLYIENIPLYLYYYSTTTFNK